MTDFTGFVTAPCICDLCGTSHEAPRLEVGIDRTIVWHIPRCQHCLDCSYTDGVADGKRNVTRTT